MKTLDRRDFLKKATLAGASALAVPTLFESCTSKASASTVVELMMIWFVLPIH